MAKKVQVNVTTRVNSASIRREKRGGRDVIIVPSATMPDNVVMNRIRYPAEKIAASFHTLEGKPAPLGHPMMDGRYISANGADGMVRSFVGAWNRNVRREGGRVLVDKVIDVAYASQLDGGKAVLEAIEKGEPIHTSTGIFCDLEELAGDPDAEWTAGDMVFDHDAILIGEDGAATPDQGVGIFVNAAGDHLEVINSTLWEEVDRDMNWQVDGLLRTIERARRIPLLERIKSSILALIEGENDPEKETETMDNKEQIAALATKVDALATAFEGLPAVIANAMAAGLKPLTDQMQANAEAEAAKAQAAHDEAAAVVVNAGLLTAELAASTPIGALKALAANAVKPEKTGLPPAYRLNSAGNGVQTPAKVEPKE